MSQVPYGRYEEAYKAIHSALSGLMAPPPGKRITKLEFTWNPDGTISALKAYEGSEELFTLNFTWSNGDLTEVSRADA